MGITIRAAVSGDEDVLARLNGSVHELHVAHRPDVFKPPRVHDVAEWFKQCLPKPTAPIWIAEEEGVPIAYVVALFRERAENPFCLARRWCEIDQIGVEPRHRAKGIGRALVQTVIAEARAQGIRDVEANSWSFNDVAHQAFRSFGFEAKEVRFELELSEQEDEH